MEEIEVEGARVKIRNWAGELEEKILTQASNCAKLPVTVGMALMPDAHAGYGMPVGGVLVTGSAVVPYAIGVDIGCGMTIIRTDLDESDLDDERVTDFLHQINRDVPTGIGPRGMHKQGQGEEFVPSLLVSRAADQAIREADRQLGTLGSGNHFLELQVDNEGGVCFMVHSGSRSVGKKICDYHHKIALAQCQERGVTLPDNELAFLDWKTPEAKQYWQDMEVAMLWAEENRRRMSGKVIAAFGKVFGRGAYQDFDVHHNFAAWEHFFGEDWVVHRKGAIRARAGDRLLIPGSMSTGSYEALGRGCVAAFDTSPHGSGRLRGRKATARLVSVEEMDRQLEEKGVILVTDDRASVVDESEAAYKDVDEVVARSADMIEIVRHMRPIGVVKG